VNWLRKLLAHFGHAPQVAKPPDLPLSTKELVKESQAVRRDLRELRRFEIVVRRR
jgi:hypothetical protein